MRTSARACALLAVTTAAVLPATAAVAAPAKAKAKPVVTLTGPKTSLTGHTVAFKDAITLPAKDKVKSWTLNYGDRTKATGTGRNVPKGAHHVYKAAGRVKVTLSVTDVHKKSWSASIVVVVSKPPVVTPPVVTPPVVTVPVYTAPTGTVYGHVTSGGVAVPGLTVDVITPGVGLLSSVTNDHGDWAVNTSGDKFVVDVNLNPTAADPLSPGATNPAYPIAVNLVPAGAWNVDLPALTATATGSAVNGSSSAGLSPTAEVDASMTIPGTVLGSFLSYGPITAGSYAVRVSPGTSWNLDAQDDDNEVGTADYVPFTAPSAGTVAGPTLTLTSDGFDDFVSAGRATTKVLHRL